MKRLLWIILLLPCLLMWADDEDKSLLVKKTDGGQLAVRLTDIDSVYIAPSDTIADSLYVTERDTVRDTITVTTTVTLTVKDTITVKDTVVVKDTVIVKDTVTIKDTLTVKDTVTLREVVTEFASTNINKASRWYYPLENPAVQDYLNNTEYDPNDYNYSTIEDYIADEGYRKEHGLGVLIEWANDADSLELSTDADYTEAWRFGLKEGSSSFIASNLIPGCKYYWRALKGGSEVASSHFYTEGHLRAINTHMVHNVRDMGGWPTEDGGKMRYGRIFRGGTVSNLTDNDRHILVDSLGITAEINLTTEAPEGTSAKLGESVVYISFTGQNVNKISVQGPYFASVIKKIAAYLNEGRVIYLHCGGGADRTGAIALLIEGVCGCSEDAICKDYELTSLSVYGVRKRVNGVVYDGITYNFASAIRWLKNRSGATLQEKVINYLKTYGVTQEEIETLQEAMK